MRCGAVFIASTSIVETVISIIMPVLGPDAKSCSSNDNGSNHTQHVVYDSGDVATKSNPMESFCSALLLLRPGVAQTVSLWKNYTLASTVTYN